MTFRKSECRVCANSSMKSTMQGHSSIYAEREREGGNDELSEAKGVERGKAITVGKDNKKREKSKAASSR